MTDTVQQVKDRLSIVDVVTGYVKLDRAGQNMRARCPFHAERSPSFIVSPDRGTYHCFGCGVGGDIFSFVEAIEGVDFKGALKILADKAGVELVYAKGGSRTGEKDEKDRLFEVMDAATLWYQKALDTASKEYLQKRGLTDETIRAFRIGFAGDAWSALTDYLKEKGFSEKEMLDAGLIKKDDRNRLTDKFRNRIMFPLADTAGRVVAFSGRTFGEHAHPDAPKYLNSPETPLFHKSRVLYGFDRAKQTIRTHNFAVLVEGQMDLIMSHQAGWSNAVAASGTAFTPEHASLLKRMSENLVIALDPDQAGFKAASRAARAALAQGMSVKVAQLPKDLDPADLILKEGADAWRACIRGAKDIITFLLDVLEEHAKDAMQLRRSVETIVLPFLHDVQSPIAREQYEREIAKRLGVSENAVREAEAKVPKPMGDTATSPAAPVRAVPQRIDQAYGLFLWQSSLAKPQLDVAVLRERMEKVIGNEGLAALEAMPKEAQERLRFEAEKLFGASNALARAADILLQVLEREHLQVALTALTEAMRLAEDRGDEVTVMRLAEEAKLLTHRIAKSSE